MKLLFVCTGNTCRSPMAEVMAASLGGGAVEASSVGLMADGCSPMSPQSRVALETLGHPVSEHRSRPLTPEDVAQYDWVITMTAQQCALLRAALPGSASHILTMSEFADGEPCDVADPYGGDDATYIACAEQMEEMIRQGLEVRGIHGANATDQA